MSEPAHRHGPFSAARSPRRARLREAVIGLALEHGLAAVGAERLCATAGFGRRAFEREFGSVLECATQVYVANVAEFDRIVFGAVEREAEWPARLRAAAYAAATYVANRPREARFNFIEMVEAGEAAQAHRDRYVRRIVALIDEGRQVAPEPGSIGPGVAEAAFGAVYQKLAEKAGEGSVNLADARAFVPELMYVAVRPYLGHEVAREELTIPPPPEPGPEGAAGEGSPP